MKIYFASDHAGFSLKNELVAHLRDEKGIEVEDCGAGFYDEKDDYTDLIPLAIQKLSTDIVMGIIANKAIILGGSGQGEAMIANRHPGIRATVYYGGENKILELSREHNDANVLSLGARFLSVDEARLAVDFWLACSFNNEERHARRNKAIDL